MGNEGKPERLSPPHNYAYVQTNLQANFLKFLQYVNLPPTRSGSTYIIQVHCNHIWDLNDVDLIMEMMCNMLDDRRQSLFLPAAGQFLTEGCFGYDETINQIRLSFIGFPASVQKFREFILSEPCFQTVQVFSSNLVILDTTQHGRLLIQMLMVALLDRHSKGFSWDGTFDITDMVVIDDGHAFKKLKIVKKPMETDECMERMHEAMIKDLQKVSKLIIPFYKASDGAMPVYFSQLKENLDGVTNELVAKPWFKKYLGFHVALMPSTARKILETMLYAIYENSDVGYIPFLLAKPTVYPTDWRRALMKLPKKNINGVLSGVYSYHSSHQAETDQYENSVHGLMRFKSNFLEQGGQVSSMSEIELELYAANMFDEFLPSLVFTLWKQGLMESVFGEAWKVFEESRSAKSDPLSN